MPRLDSSTTNADSPPAIAGTFAAAARHDAMPALGPVFPLLLALASDEPAAAAIRMTRPWSERSATFATPKS
jgi:hypothetical protein